MSTFIYTWYTTDHQDPKKILKRNKQFFQDQMTQTIDHVRKMIEELPPFFQDPDLVQVLIEERDHFLNQYNLKVLMGPLHTQWVDEQIGKFHSNARLVKRYCFQVKMLHQEKLDRYELESLIHYVPHFAHSLRRKMEKMVEMLDEIDRICSENNPDTEALLHYLDSLPKDFFHIKQKISRLLLKSASGEKQETAQDDLASLKDEANSVFQKIKALSQDLARKYEHLMDAMRVTKDFQRAEIILDEIRYAYAKAHSIYMQTQVLKDELSEYSELAQKVGMSEELDRLLDKPEVSENEVETFIQNLIRKHMDLQRGQEVLQNVSRMLAKYGYGLIDPAKLKQLFSGYRIEIPTPFGEDYKLWIKLQENALAIRFVRYVDDEHLLSAYEREKDKAIAREWCSTYDKISELLALQGIILESQYRISADSKFYYVRRKSSSSGRRDSRLNDTRINRKGGKAT